MRKIILLSFLMLMIYGTCYAESSMILGNTEIKIGQSQSELEWKLKNQFNVNVIPGNNGYESYMLVTKSGPPFNLIGSVTFHNGIVSNIVRDWGSYNFPDQSTALANALEIIINQGYNNPQIKIERNNMPNASIENIAFNFADGKRVNLSIIYGTVNGQNISQAAISESINE